MSKQLQWVGKIPTNSIQAHNTFGITDGHTGLVLLH